MPVQFQQIALIAFLKNKQPSLYGKLVELRNTVQDWLAYVPQTFPHYTRHTLPHSDAILLQISKLLFQDDDPTSPVLSLSPMEVYVVAAAAYLHDAGMVASDREKVEIIGSDAWREWTTGEGAGAKRWAEIGRFRNGHTPSDAALRNFLADVQTRFLVADFVRRIHHHRVKEVIAQHEGQMGQFASNDPVLLRTIADVCVAHGLEQREIEDQDRYPERRDVQGQVVNVRFVAILLRLGDLLEMSHDRACPLLLSAACPLPAQSFAHWTQYQRIIHSLTAPDRIEIAAKCQNQEEHRFLKDWCQWLVDEVKNAAVLMGRSTRHSEWQLPKVSMDCPDATIKILPAANATYIPSNWKFELSQEAVFKRLIEDLYEHPHTFIRELIQNALDATRCQLYLDLSKKGVQTPEFPTQAAEEYRNRYPIHISLEIQRWNNPLSGETENRHVVIVEDPGLGMDRDIVLRYFLQVGRSYYTTAEFQRNFRFVPTSRFGLGFLSVFGVSDHVVVETFKPTSPANEGPLKMVLTGPRNYLLVEKGQRRNSGTRIEVLLREPLAAGQLIREVSDWCRRVEFPIIVNELGTETIIRSEQREEFAYEMPDITKDGAKFVVRAFDVNRPGFEGELYVFARIDTRGESWAEWAYAQYEYPKKHPQASSPPFPRPIRCLHGIALHAGYAPGPMSARLDYRGSAGIPVLSRDWPHGRRIAGWEEDPKIVSRWVEILSEHLATSERAKSADGWEYKQSLVDDFPFPAFWRSVPETIPLHIREQARLVSLQDLEGMPLIATVLTPQSALHPAAAIGQKRSEIELRWDDDTPAIRDKHVNLLSNGHRSSIFQGRPYESLRWLRSGHLALYWKLDMRSKPLLQRGPSKPAIWGALPDNTFTVAFEIHKTVNRTYESVFLNTNNAFAQWLLRVKNNCSRNAHGLKKEQYDLVYDLVDTAARYHSYLYDLTNYLKGWYDIRGLPHELYPPRINLTSKMFVLVRDPGMLTETA